MQLQQLLTSFLLATLGTTAPLDEGTGISKRFTEATLLQKRAPVTGEYCGCKLVYNTY
jgi:hypothetical protein